MQIKSDETPKQNKFKEFLKKHQVSEISRTIAFVIVIVVSVILLFVTLTSVYDEQKSVLREHEEKQVQQIITHKPVIKCFGKHFLPEEYDLEIDTGRNVFKVFYPQRNLDETFYLSDCKLILTKTQLTVTENFREAVFKKRGFISASAKDEHEAQRLAKIKEEKIQKETPPKESKPTEVVSNTNTNIVVSNSSNGSFHTAEYYLKLEYATLYPALVQATKDLKEYHQTDEYKKLKEKRFGQNKTTRTLNRAYNAVHGKMWRLHQRFGTRYGTYKDLESGKLIVNFVNGQLEFLGDV